MIWFPAYFATAAIIFFLLGFFWGGEDDFNRRIRIGFFFLFIVGIVFAMLAVKGFLI
jgi:hypothetical protein